MTETGKEEMTQESISHKSKLQVKYGDITGKSILSLEVLNMSPALRLLGDDMTKYREIEISSVHLRPVIKYDTLW